MSHKFTNWTVSTVLTDRDIKDPDARALVLVDNDKHKLHDYTVDEIKAMLKTGKRLTMPQIKWATGGSDPKAPVELYLNSVARGLGLPEPFPGYRNDYKFPEKRIEDAARDSDLRVYVTQDDIARAAQAVARWRDGSNPSDEVLQVIAASEVAEEGGVLVLWSDLLRSYEAHGNDKHKGGGTHMHRWHSCNRLFSTALVSHPEIMTSAWVGVRDLVKTVEMQRGEHSAYLYACPEFQRIKNALWENTVCPYAEFIECVVYGHGEALMHAFNGDGKPETVCRVRGAKTCV